MKQVFNKRGEIKVEEVPAPLAGDNEVLVQVYYSCISSGTELSVLKSGGKSVLKKVIDKPQNIKKVLVMIKEKGLMSSIGRVKNKIETSNPLGYSAAGIVLETGKSVYDFKPGDRVACAGAGISNHAEFISVPVNLAVKVPESLALESASTVALGAIALQGVRRSAPEIGSFVAVIGLGILGQITVQLLNISGCRVIGIDIDKKRIEKAKSFGLYKGIDASTCGNVVEDVRKATEGYGADAVIITAASSGEALINQSVEMSRRKGKVVIVGDVLLNISREEFYKRELDILISTSYGPGRYDENYELKGYKYPYEYIRWTENRNMMEYINLLADGKLKVDNLIEAVFAVEDAPAAYESIKTPDKPLIVILKYNREAKYSNRINLRATDMAAGAAADMADGKASGLTAGAIADTASGAGADTACRKTADSVIGDLSDTAGRTADAKARAAFNSGSRINIGLIGAGSFTKDMHLPNLEKLKSIFNIYAVCSKDGAEAASVANQYGASFSTTDYREILKNDDIGMALITTRHDLHARIAIEALNAGKAVFVEKPMALNDEELDEIIETIKKTKMPYTVGFNRRFSPYAEAAKGLVNNRVSPLIINYTMNAGFIPKEHWVHTEEGGGRNIGEACHIYDLFNYLTDSVVEHVCAFSITPKSGQFLLNDNFCATLKYCDGSVCNLIYTALGAKSAQKEKMEIYYDSKMISLSDYKELKLYDQSEKTIKKGLQDKGHMEELRRFGQALLDKSENNIIPIPGLAWATGVSFEVERQIKQ
jgi:predicted dehydrogenase/threonine dehydrogenase-like Zn-dependent dehydrogenase